MKLKVFFYGSRKTEQKLRSSLNGNGFHLIPFTDLTGAFSLLKQEKCDVFVVDNAMENAHAVCHFVSHLGNIPVVLYISKRQTNWERLTSLNVDGYLSSRIGGAELSARLLAVVRRHSPNADKSNADTGPASPDFNGVLKLN